MKGGQADEGKGQEKLKAKKKETGDEETGE